MPLRILDFLRFLGRVWTPEKLPSPSPSRSDLPESAAATTLRSIFATETLPPPRPAGHGTIGATTLRRFLGRDDLPFAAGDSTPPSRSLVRFILTREKLPSATEME